MDVRPTPAGAADDDDTTPLRRALAAGLCLNAARRQPDGSYRLMSVGAAAASAAAAGVGGGSGGYAVVHVHPSSVLFDLRRDGSFGGGGRDGTEVEGTAGRGNGGEGALAAAGTGPFFHLEGRRTPVTDCVDNRQILYCLLI